MTYSRCPFEVVVEGRDKQAALFYRFARWRLRAGRRELDQAVRRAVGDVLEEEMVMGTGYWRNQILDRVPPRPGSV